MMKKSRHLICCLSIIILSLALTTHAFCYALLDITKDSKIKNVKSKLTENDYIVRDDNKSLLGLPPRLFEEIGHTDLSNNHSLIEKFNKQGAINARARVELTEFISELKINSNMENSFYRYSSERSVNLFYSEISDLILLICAKIEEGKVYKLKTNIDEYLDKPGQKIKENNANIGYFWPKKEYNIFLDIRRSRYPQLIITYTNNIKNLYEHVAEIRESNLSDILSKVNEANQNFSFINIESETKKSIAKDHIKNSSFNFIKQFDLTIAHFGYSSPRTFRFMTKNIELDALYKNYEILSDITFNDKYKEALNDKIFINLLQINPDSPDGIFAHGTKRQLKRYAPHPIFCKFSKFSSKPILIEAQINDKYFNNVLSVMSEKYGEPAFKIEKGSSLLYYWKKAKSTMVLQNRRNDFPDFQIIFGSNLRSFQSNIQDISKEKYEKGKHSGSDAF